MDSRRRRRILYVCTIWSLASLVGRNCGQFAAVVMTRLRRMRWQHGLLAAARFDLAALLGSSG